MEGTSHSAGGPLGGYEWQLRKALLVLLRSQTGGFIEVETRDDVVVYLASGHIGASLQAKHSFDDSRLSAKSVELWKTLAAWIDAGEPASKQSAEMLVLATTDSVDCESSLFPFTQVKRVPASAASVATLQRELDVVASDGGNKKLAKAYGLWLKLHPRQKATILGKFVLVVGEARLGQIWDELLEACGNLSPEDSRERFCQALVGWFTSAVDQRLSPQGCRITLEEMRSEIYSLQAIYGERPTLSKYAAKEHPDLEQAMGEDARYLEQLRLVGASEPLLRTAAVTFYRARLERDRWMQHSPSGVTDLSAFDAELSVHWEFLFHSTQTPDPAAAGRGTYLSCVSHAFGCAGLPAGTHLVAGTFNILADTHGSIGWHPDYEELLAANGGENE